MTTDLVVTITDELVAELEAAAQSATQGDWDIVPDSSNGKDEAWCYWHKVGPLSIPGINAGADGKFVSRCNPATILALLSERAELKRDADIYRAALEQIVEIEMQEIGGDWDEIEEAQAIAQAALDQSMQERQK